METKLDPFMVFSNITKVLYEGMNPHTAGAINMKPNHNRFM